MRLELAADYLVMAAWLAYLKSRLLLPETRRATGAERRGHGDRARLRLKRLEAIREAAGQLTGRPQLGRDVFGRGAPEPIADIKRPEWSATLYDLLSAYAAQRQKSALAHVRFAPRTRVVARRSARRRSSGWSARRPTGAGSTSSCSPIWSSRRCARPCSRRASRRRWKWCAKARSRCSRRGAFAPIYLRKRADERPAIRPVRCRAGSDGSSNRRNGSGEASNR